jgi:hypothetical protein
MCHPPAGCSRGLAEELRACILLKLLSHSPLAEDRSWLTHRGVTSVF